MSTVIDQLKKKHAQDNAADSQCAKVSSAHSWMKTHGARLYDDALAPMAMGLLEQTTTQDSLPIGKAYVFHDGSAIIDDVVTGAVLVQNDYSEQKAATEKTKETSKIRTFMEDVFGMK